MDEKLSSIKDRVLQLTEKYPEFGEMLRAALHVQLNYSAINDIKAIREALDIRENLSIDYTFVEDERIRNQLEIDNLRMENTALNLKYDENTRFKVFCTQAFSQVETLLNYFYNSVFNRDVQHILKFVEFRTKDEKEKRYRFEPKEQKDVYSIDMVHKINAFATQFAKGDKVSLGMLRTVRNGYIHENPKEPTKHYIQFVTSNSMESIRALLKRFVSSVKTHLLAPPLQTGTIKSALPGAYVIVWDGKEQSEVIDKSCLPNANKNDRIMKVWGVCIPT